MVGYAGPIKVHTFDDKGLLRFLGVKDVVDALCYETLFSGRLELDHSDIVSDFFGYRTILIGGSFYIDDDEIIPGKDYRLIINYGPLNGFNEIYFKARVFRKLSPHESMEPKFIPGNIFRKIKKLRNIDADPSDTTLLNDIRFMIEHHDDIIERMKIRKESYKGLDMAG